MSRSTFTAQTGFLIASFFALVGSAAFHWAVQSSMTSNTIMAATMTAVFVLAPPVFVGFMFPRSPAGMLLMKTQMPTWGGVVLAASACFVVGYDFVLTWNWWLLPEQGVVAEAGYATMQAVLAMFGFGLLLAPASTPEVVHAMHQAHLVKRYELQTQAELAMLRRTSIDAQALAARGWADLNPQERRFLGGVLHGLVNGIDQTLRDMTTSVKAVAGVAVPYQGLGANTAVQHSLQQIEQALLPGESSTDVRRGGPAPRTPGDTDQRAAQPSAARPTDRVSAR